VAQLGIVRRRVMTFLSFLSEADFGASVVVDAAVVYFAFLAYRRTSMAAFAFLLWGALISLILEIGLHLRTPTSSQDYLSFREWYRVGYFTETALWGIGVVLLIRYVLRDFGRKSSPNTALEPTAAAPSVLDAPSNPKAGSDSTSASGGGGSALDR
jgi:hypothetical protein